MNKIFTFAGLRLACGPLAYKNGKFVISKDWKQNSFGKASGKTEGSTYFNWNEVRDINLDGWCLPTTKEWEAILGTNRKGAIYNGKKNSCFAYIEVDGIHDGLLLFPDNAIINGIQIIGINQQGIATELQDEDPTNVGEQQLKELLEQGCVFIPAIGFRDTVIGLNDGDVRQEGGWSEFDHLGIYWLNDEEDEDNAWTFYFDLLEGNFDYSDKINCYPIRLIK